MVGRYKIDRFLLGRDRLDGAGCQGIYAFEWTNGMKPEEAEFLKKLQAAFRIEAEEHLAAISSGLLELEKRRSMRRDEIVATIFREAHSLKGAARAVSSAEIKTICQALEDVFAGWKRDAAQASRSCSIGSTGPSTRRGGCFPMPRGSLRPYRR